MLILSRLFFRRAARQSDEGGSVAIAITVVMILSIALISALTAVNSGLNLTANDQQRSNAFQFANAGMDQALYRVDRVDLPTSSSGDCTTGACYVPTVTGSKVTAFRELVTSGQTTYEINAAQNPPGQSSVWKVRATGTDPTGQRRQAIADVHASLLFTDAFFTLRDFTLTGEQKSPRAYRSSLCPDPRAFASAPHVNCNIFPVPSRLGTNATFSGAQQTVRSFAESWEGFTMYGRTTFAAANQACAETRCTGQGGNVQAVSNRREIVVPEPPRTGVLACPSGGIIGAKTVTTTIEPGNYVCNDLTLKGTITVGSAGNGTGQVRFWVQGAFVVDKGAIVNRAQPTPKMQVYQYQSPGGGSICGSEIWALLYTPGLPIACEGEHQPEIFGAVVADLHGGTGNHFDFHWDMDSYYGADNGKYVIKNWRECPPTTTDC